MNCHLRWPYRTSPECGLPMVTRTTPGVGRLDVCPVHDGDAADHTKVDRRFNQPRRPEDRP